jgi:hypothetical protein
MSKPSWPHLAFLLFSAYWLVWLLAPAWLLAHPGYWGAPLFLAVNLLSLAQARERLAVMAFLPQLAVLMLWVMPALQYQLEAWHGAFDGMRMAVDAGTYFGVAIPGVLAVGWAFFVPLPHGDLDERAILDRALASVAARPWVLGVLAAVGLAALWLGVRVPAGLNFPVYLARCMSYVLAILLALLPALPRRGLWLGTLGTVLALDAVRTAMFGEALTTVLVALLFAVFYYRWPVWKLALGQILLFLALCWLLSFKYHYRQAKTADMPLTTQLATLGRVAWQASVDVDGFEQRVDGVVARLSQGANTSVILSYVPDRQPFVHGATIRDAVLSAAVPRMLWPDKPRAGGAEHIRRFMGIEHLPYSINLGVVGESYVNYGRQWGFVGFLMAYVLVFRGLYVWWMGQSRRWPGLLLLLPVVFFVVNWVEMDVNIVLNHVVKAGVFFYVLVFFSTKRLLG